MGASLWKMKNLIILLLVLPESTRVVVRLKMDTGHTSQGFGKCEVPWEQQGYRDDAIWESSRLAGEIKMAIQRVKT